LAESGPGHVYAVKFSVQNESDTKARIHLQYFVPYTAVPADLQRRMQSSTAPWFPLVPSASAQEGGGSSMGMDVASDTAVEITKEVLKQTAEHGKLSKEFPTPLSRLVDILNAFKKEQEHVAWLDELAELQDCAENPTNPLTQKAFNQDPAYRDQVVHGVTQARSDVTAMTGMRFLNLATAVATDLVEGPLGAITAPISSYNDETLKDLAENRVREAGKGIVPCHNPPMTPGHFQPMKGTVESSTRGRTRIAPTTAAVSAKRIALPPGRLCFIRIPRAGGFCQEKARPPGIRKQMADSPIPSAVAKTIRLSPVP
jgi:hypothetical protein